jgi:calcineurin-like phosphoesterase family protein
VTKFRDDIDPATTWLISDTHFGHKNIIEFCHRPTDFEQIIMEEWASAVGDNDTVLHLGDLVYKGNASFRALIAPHLTGARKLLVSGNHDKQRYSFYKKCGFRLASPFSIMWGNTEVSFSHYPWGPPDDEGRMPENYLRIHGHIHNNGYTRSAYVPFLKNHINMSVEQTKFKPVNLALLLSAQLDGSMPGGSQFPDAIGADAIEKENPHVD